MNICKGNGPVINEEENKNKEHYKISYNPEAMLRIGIDKNVDKKEKLLMIAASLSLGIVFDLLFSKNSFGISYPLFVMLFEGFFIISSAESIKTDKLMHFIYFIPVFLLSITFAINTNGFLHGINFLIMPFLFTAYTVIVTRPEWTEFALVRDVFSRLFYKSFSCIHKPFIFIKALLPKGKNPDKKNIYLNIILGAVISIALLILIIPMLATADMAFDYYMSNISTIFSNIKIGNAVFHTILITAVSLYTFGYMWSFKYPFSSKKEKESFTSPKAEPIIIIMVLTAINIVYLIFTVIQFSFLYSGANNVLPEGFTYAEYARSGFFELVRVTIINLAILLCSIKLMTQDSKMVLGIRILQSLLVIFTVNMLFSAHYRMALYEESYGYTHLRIYVHIFMLLLFIIFMIALLNIWNRSIPLAKASIASALIMYIALNYINVDRVIAEKNIERYYKTGSIDLEYLVSLSYDAVPTVAILAGDKNKETAFRIKAEMRNWRAELNLNSAWFEYNMSKSKAKRMLNEYFGN